MKAILRAVPAAAILIVAMFLVLTSTQHANLAARHATKLQTRTFATNTPNTQNTPNTGSVHGQRVAGKYIVMYNGQDAAGRDAKVRARNHKDLVGGLAARGVQVEILHRLDSPLLNGAIVQLTGDDDPRVHARHEEYLRALPHVSKIEAVRIIVQSDDKGPKQNLQRRQSSSSDDTLAGSGSDSDGSGDTLVGPGYSSDSDSDSDSGVPFYGSANDMMYDSGDEGSLYGSVSDSDSSGYDSDGSVSDSDSSDATRVGSGYTSDTLVGSGYTSGGTLVGSGYTSDNTLVGSGYTSDTLVGSGYTSGGTLVGSDSESDDTLVGPGYNSDDTLVGSGYNSGGSNTNRVRSDRNSGSNSGAPRAGSGYNSDTTLVGSDSESDSNSGDTLVDSPNNMMDDSSDSDSDSDSDRNSGGVPLTGWGYNPASSSDTDSESDSGGVPLTGWGSAGSSDTPLGSSDSDSDGDSDSHSDSHSGGVPLTGWDYNPAGNSAGSSDTDSDSDSAGSSDSESGGVPLTGWGSNPAGNSASSSDTDSDSDSAGSSDSESGGVPLAGWGYNSDGDSDSDSAGSSDSDSDSDSDNGSGSDSGYDSYGSDAPNKRRNIDSRMEGIFKSSGSDVRQKMIKEDDKLAGLQLDRIDYVHRYTGVQEAHAHGINGTGVRIALIGGGIDYTHKDLGGCFGVSDDGRPCKVAFGDDMVGDVYQENAADDAQRAPRPPRGACNGVTSTHMAGVLVGKNDKVGYAGVALGATLGAYRIYDCQGRSDTALQLLSLLAAHQQQARIVVFAKPYPLPGEHDVWVEALDWAVQSGMAVFMGVGNSWNGRRMFGIGEANNVPGVITVTNAALDGHKRGRTVSTDSTFARIGMTTRARPAGDGRDASVDTMEVAPMLYTDVQSGWYRAVKAPDNICEPGQAAGLARQKDDEVLVLPDDECVHQDAVTAKLQAAGAHRLLFTSADPWLSVAQERPFHAWTPKFSAFASARTVQAWWRQEGGVEVYLASPDDRVLSAYALHPPEPHWTISPYSDMGPSRVLGLQPVLAAPGSYMLAVQGRDLGEYGIYSDSHFAAAYAAGCAAMLLQSTPQMTPHQLAQALVSTATSAKTSSGDAAVPLQGAGVVNVGAALTAQREARNPGEAPIRTDRLYVQLGDSESGGPQTVEVCNNFKGADAVEFQIVQRALPTMPILNDMYWPMQWPRDADGDTSSPPVRLRIEPDRFSLAPAACRDVVVSVVTSNRDYTGLDPYRLPVFSGDLVISTTPASKYSHKLPYLGSTGDMSYVSPIHPNGTHSYVVGDRQHDAHDAHDANNAQQVPVFNLAEMAQNGETGNIMGVEFDIVLPPRELVLSAVRLVPGNDDEIADIVWEMAFDDYIQQSHLQRAEWDGRTMDGEFAPPGRYRLDVVAMHDGPDDVFSDVRTQVFEIV